MASNPIIYFDSFPIVLCRTKEGDLFPSRSPSILLLSFYIIFTLKLTRPWYEWFFR